jgi:hypothetical protein
MPTLAAELWQLLRDYARQETLAPLKGVARSVGFGVLGSLLLGTGLVLAAVAGLRALQTETGDAFAGNWSWAPYGIVLVGCLAVAGLAVSRVGKRR